MSLANKKYSNPSQLAQRNESLFVNKNILVAGNIVDDYPMHLETLASSSTFCFSDYRYFSHLRGKLSSSEVHFTANYEGDKKFNLLILFLPKAKQETISVPPEIDDNLLFSYPLKPIVSLPSN